MGENKCLTIALIGEPGSGKSQLLNRYINDKFSEYYQPSIGIASGEILSEFQNKRFSNKILDAATVDLLTTTPELLDKINAFIIVVDYTSMASISSIEKYVTFCGSKVRAIFGNKTDICPDYKTIESKLINQFGQNGYFSGNVKENVNIDDVFEWVIRQLDDQHALSSRPTERDIPKADKEEKPVNQSKCCLLI